MEAGSDEFLGKAGDPRQIRYGVGAAWPPPSPFPTGLARWKPATRSRFGMAAPFPA